MLLPAFSCPCPRHTYHCPLLLTPVHPILFYYFQRHRLSELTDQHQDLLGLLAQQEVELGVFRSALSAQVGAQQATPPHLTRWHGVACLLFYLHICFLPPLCLAVLLKAIACFIFTKWSLCLALILTKIVRCSVERQLCWRRRTNRS